MWWKARTDPCKLPCDFHIKACAFMYMHVRVWLRMRTRTVFKTCLNIGLLAEFWGDPMWGEMLTEAVHLL